MNRRDAMALLVDHDWPGNVTQLQRVVNQALVTAKGDVVDVDAVKPLLEAE